MQPKDEVELTHLLHSAFKWDCTVIMRYPRGTTPGSREPETLEFIEPGTAEVLEEGSDIQIWALGDMIPLAHLTASRLKKQGFSVGVVNARFAKPIDTDLLDSQCHSRVIATMENGAVMGGLGTAIEEYISHKGYSLRVEKFGWPDEFITHGKVDAIYERYGLTPEAMAKRIEEGMSVRV
jgi:1-deoxy-D-xylulose-5-phosphate synthase